MKRNSLVEWMRFLFSLLVVGYHIQMPMKDGAAHFFANGAVAVEFFFLISGYFFARSVEKAHQKQAGNLMKATGQMMKGKLLGILPAHVTAMLLMLLVVVCCDTAHAGERIVQGIPGIFLIQMGMFWNGSYNQSLIIPEWYLSSMLLCMLVMFPVLLLLLKRRKLLPSILISLGIFTALALLLTWLLGCMPQNLVWDFRAMIELHLGMLIYVFAARLPKPLAQLSEKQYMLMEALGYGVPVLLGFLPLSASMQPLCMGVTVIGVAAGMLVTFSGNGRQIKNDGINRVFTYLGGISLYIYLFHPVLIELFTNAVPAASLPLRMAVLLPASIGCAGLFSYAMQRFAWPLQKG